MPLPAFLGHIPPDSEGLVNAILRKGTPKRVYFIELLMDPEVQVMLCERFGLLERLEPKHPLTRLRVQVAVQKYLGYDYVSAGVDGINLPAKYSLTPDTAGLSRAGGRAFVDEHAGPITSWQEFEEYPWPEPSSLSTRTLEWYEKNLPDAMCILGYGGEFCEQLLGLMGYETLSYALFEQRDLVRAISDKLLELYMQATRLMLQFGKVKVVWGNDDMGHRTATMISPKDMREFVLPGHKLSAEMTHAAGRPYILHSCGNLTQIMPDLLDDVKIDGKHSFEDNIELVADVKQTYGKRIALLGGIDMDFLCRSDEQGVRRRVRETLEKCMPGGGFCLGTGNSVANFLPMENYLAMLDEGRRFAV